MPSVLLNWTYKFFVRGLNYFTYLPFDDTGVKMLFGMTTLSSEFLAQSTMPFRPFIGKLMSVRTEAAGSFWMLATVKKEVMMSTKIFQRYQNWSN